jgi:hypothetical protein
MDLDPHPSDDSEGEEDDGEGVDQTTFVEGGGQFPSSRNPTPYSSVADRKPRKVVQEEQGQQQGEDQQQRHQQQEHEQQPARPSRSLPPPPTTPPRRALSARTAPSLTFRQYGAPIEATTSGNFPSVGSTLGPYFVLGRLGQGTFCSIHKCVNLQYHHRLGAAEGNDEDDDEGGGSGGGGGGILGNSSCNGSGGEGSSSLPLDPQSLRQQRRFRRRRSQPRLAAAKVEIGEFKNSGVLGGEAAILHFLDSVLPPHTVPVYMGHYRSSSGNANHASGTNNNNSNAAATTTTSAIVMEYLSGQDMAVIRDWTMRMQPKRKSTGSRPRRLAVEDAVHLTANVLLPLLERMHEVGIVHRDVSGSTRNGRRKRNETKQKKTKRNNKKRTPCAAA